MTRSKSSAASTTNYERAMAEFEATITPAEHALGVAIVADFEAGLARDHRAARRLIELATSSDTAPGDVRHG